MNLSNLKIKSVPAAPALKHLLGPSFILLGLGLGSGEVILWPYLTSNYGLGIIWGAILGITFQYFINMEISRYSLCHGESIFVGFARKLKALPYWGYCKKCGAENKVGACSGPCFVAVLQEQVK